MTYAWFIFLSFPTNNYWSGELYKLNSAPNTSVWFNTLDFFSFLIVVSGRERHTKKSQDALHPRDLKGSLPDWIESL